MLDFASLYPSIMRFWNLSYDTFLRSDAEAEAKGLRPDQVYTTPNGFKFAKKEVAEGILPMIETELLLARKRAKKQMKEATDPLARSVFDGKQASAVSRRAPFEISLSILTGCVSLCVFSTAGAQGEFVSIRRRGRRIPMS